MNAVDARDTQPLIVVRDRLSADRFTDRPYRSTELLKLRAGVYADLQWWQGLDATQRYAATIRAAVAVRTGRRPVVGFESAAVLWGYPRLGPPPSLVHLCFDVNSGARNAPGVRVHRDDLPDRDVVERDGLTLTSPARTLVDLARTAPFLTAVCAIDGALNLRKCSPRARVTKDDLLSVLSRCTTRRGRLRAEYAIRFADGRADGPRETQSRVLIHQFGLPRPELQVRHANPRGGNYYTDFEWTAVHLVGEFDGRQKYLASEYRNGRSSAEIVVEEKIREDHIRAEGNRFARWTVADLDAPPRLRALLAPYFR